MPSVSKGIFDFVDCLTPAGEYFLSQAKLRVADSRTFVFTATLNGPPGAAVWARAWVSNHTDKTLAEAASPPMQAGDELSIAVKLNGETIPDHAYLRIESAPLKTEHVVGVELI